MQAKSVMGDVRHMVHVNGWELAVMAGEGEGEQELRVRDIDLGERLGFDRPRDVRKLIERYAKTGEITPLSNRATVARFDSAGNSRGSIEVTEYWLDEADALFVIAKSDTTKANALTREMIRVYMLARRGLLPGQAGIPNELIAALAQIAETQKQQRDEVAAIAHRLATLESCGGTISRIQDASIRQLVATIARGRAHAGLSPSRRSATTWVYNRVFSVAAWTGTGRKLANMPADRYPIVLAELDALRREVRAAIKALATQRALLPLADDDDEPKKH